MKKIKQDIKSGITIFFTILVLGVITTFAANWYDSFSVISNEQLSSTKWNNLAKSTVPSGAVMSFYLTSCPDGWRAADGTNSTPDLRGVFIRGLNNFGSTVGTRNDGIQDPETRTLGSFQTGSAIYDNYQNSTSPDNDGAVYNEDGYYNTSVAGLTFSYTYNTYTRKFSYIRPRNVALIYCIKQ